jgi:hypothetical protein
MEQTPPWEDDSHSAGQGSPCLLYNRNFHYCVHKCPLLDPIRIQMNPTNILTSYFLKVSKASCTLQGHPSDPFPSSFRTKYFHTFLISSCVLHVLSISFFFIFFHPLNIWWTVQIMKLSNYVIFSILPLPFVSYLNAMYFMSYPFLIW